MKARILIVDDDQGLARLVASVLGDAGYELQVCATGAAAVQAFEERPPDAVVTDLRMPGMDGMDLLRELHRRQAALPVILLTGHASVPAAVRAIREGAFDYITKPFEEDDLIATVERAVAMSRLERDNRFLRSASGPSATDDVIAESAAMRELLEIVRRVAPRRSTVLIQGETGTGKEVLARLLHYWSERVEQPFIRVNCKAFAEGLLESELFGHEKGAFTGAVTARAGCFERAHRGTLFLDEIGEISASFQAKLLRVLQEGEVQRVGGNQTRSVDVRVVAATNRRLREEVAAGRFREDLFFRLNVIPLSITPLRARKEDVLPLARRFLQIHCAELNTALTLSPRAQQALLAHSWPGNVRELENAIERGAALASDSVIEPEVLFMDSPSAQRESTQPEAGAPLGELSLHEYLDSVTNALIADALAKTNGNRSATASLLRIDRVTLYRLMKRLGTEASPRSAEQPDLRH